MATLPDQIIAIIKADMPNATNEEIFAEFQEIVLAGINAGTIAAIRIGNDNLIKHVEHCTDKELKNALTAKQYANLMER